MTNITTYTYTLHAIVLLRAATASWRVSLLFPFLFRVPGLQEFFEEEYRYRRRAYLKKIQCFKYKYKYRIFCFVMWNPGYNRSLLALACLQMRLNWGKSSDDTTRTVIIAYFHVLVASSLIGTILFCLKYNLCFLLSLHKATCGHVTCSVSIAIVFIMYAIYFYWYSHIHWYILMYIKQKIHEYLLINLTKIWFKFNVWLNV